MVILPLALLMTAPLVPRTAIDFRQPQVAASDRMVAVTFGSRNSIFFTASRDQGKTFTSPRKVAEPGALALGMHRGPRIAITPLAVVITAVAGAQGKGMDGDLLAFRSTDGGVSWSAGTAVNDVPGSAREGLHAMAANANGLLYVAWLDLRSKGTHLYGASSTDGGLTWSKNVLVYESPSGSICQCCHPSLAIAPSGEIYAMWRNEIDGFRDMYFASSTDGGKTFGKAAKIGAGTWKLNACPMDGGGIAITPDNKLVSAWRRESSIYLAQGEEVEHLMEEGKNAAIAATSQGVFAIWQTQIGLRARIPGNKDPFIVDTEGEYPQLAALPNGSVLATWERKGVIQFRILP